MRRPNEDEQLGFEFSSKAVELQPGVKVGRAEVVSFELKKQERELDLRKLLIQRIRARAQHLV